jgi:hypothetical protein
MAFCKGRWSIGIWVGRGSSGEEYRFDTGSGEDEKVVGCGHTRIGEIFTRYRYNMCD